MLRKLIVLAATAALAKKAWDQYQSSQSQSQSPTQSPRSPSAADPLATHEDADAPSVTAQPVAPESPMQYH